MKWKTEKREISELKPFPGNPRKADEKEVKDLDRSLERFDVADPLIINTDNVVIGGNFRLSRLKEKGIKEVDVRVPDRKLTRKEAEELNLRLNKNQGNWDNDLLANFDEDLLKEVGWEGEEILEIFSLSEIDNYEVDFDRLQVLMVNPVGGVKLKERLLLQFEKEDYDKLKRFLENEENERFLKEKIIGLL